MRNRLGHIGACTALAVLTASASPTLAQAVKLVPSATANLGEASYKQEPLPPGFKVVVTEMEGPVFADSRGMTLYSRPGNGATGELKGKPTCDNTKYTTTTAGHSPYPEGLELPELDSRPTCLQMWTPLAATPDAKPIGEWSIVTRLDGTKQWARNGYAVYTSNYDKHPGDILGAERGVRDGRGAGGYVGSSGFGFLTPSYITPAQFDVTSIVLGKFLTLANGNSVYISDKDGTNKSNCYGACEQEWKPVVAAGTVTSAGDWTVFERAPGVKQWAYKGRPLYTHVTDKDLRSVEGTVVPGWSNAYVHRRPLPPKGFTQQESRGGVVLADAAGKTIYTYNCTDAGRDAQTCETPESPQVYRFAICGGGDPDRCVKAFPYVLADKAAKSDSQIWSIMYINPKTGRRATDRDAAALRVWAFRDRPVYTFAGYEVGGVSYGDKKPGDIEADRWGEMSGARNGFSAFFLRQEGRDGP